MAYNVLLTSLSTAENNLPLRYYSIRNEYDYDYCDVLLDAEASMKAMLARYDIDEIIVIGEGNDYQEEDLKRVPISHGNTLYSADKASLSTYELLQYRLAQYFDEQNLELKAEVECIPGEVRDKLIRFISDFRDGNTELKAKKHNRLFDAMAQSDRIYESFRTELLKAFPEFHDQPDSCIQWVKSYLYSELKPTAMLELLPVNEKTGIRLIPAERIEDREQWVDSMMSMKESIVDDKDDINLYVSLSSEDAGDTFVIMNILDILVSMPGSGVHLKQIFTVRSIPGQMTGVIRDDTDGFGVTELIHAARAFLNYGRVDMIVDIWKKSGVHSEKIQAMIYAMRHVDVGLSMCNISEMEDGILRLRALFRDENVWRELGYYGMLFSVIAESIREDYGVLLEGEGEIPFIDLVKWAYRHQFYQQTLTLIEAKAPEDLVHSGMFYYCGDEKDTEQIVQLLAQQRLELKPYEYYKIDNIDHYFIKTYNRSKTRGLGARGEDSQHVYAALRTQSVENKDPSQITGLTACDSKETLQKLLYAYYHIGDVRNKINHAETDAVAAKRLIVSESDESSVLSWMKESVDFFIDSYEKAMKEVADQKPHVVTIAGDEVRKAADRMKRDRQKGNS